MYENIRVPPLGVIYPTLQRANNKGADQSAWMRRLVCTFVVRMQQSDFLAVLVHLISCYELALGIFTLQMEKCEN